MSRRPPLHTAVYAALLALVLIIRTAPLSWAAETVRVTLPASVTFSVTNVSVQTTGTPNPTTPSFSNWALLAGKALRMSVKADADFTPPSGTAIPASRVTWTTSGAVNGTGSAGTLSKTVYTQLYQSNTTSKSTGSVNVVWKLAAPGTSIRAGNHVLTLRWKFESI